jgi:hypothetical protein
MTSEEILKKSKWSHDRLMKFDLFSILFNKNIEVTISFDTTESRKLISDKTLETINEFQAIDKNEIEIINDEIWKHCLGCNQTTRSSFDGGKTWNEFKLEDNLAEYGIKTKEDALKQSNITGIYIVDNWGVDERVFWLSVGTTWDREHAINLVYRNGKLSDVG